MKIKIRKANIEDLDEIMILIECITDFHYKLDKYYKSFVEYQGLNEYIQQQLEDENTKILLAEVDEKIVGFIVGVILKAPGYIVPKKIGNIDNAFVKEDYRHQKIGENLIKELFKWFKEKKVKHIELSVDARNTIGINAWRKFGFFDFRIEMKKEL